MLVFIFSLVLTILSVLDLVYRIIEYKPNTFYDIITYIVLLAAIYYIGQLISTIKRFRIRKASNDKKAPAGSPEVIRDNLFKYLLSWTIGLLFIEEIVVLLNSEFDVFKNIKDKGKLTLRCLDQIFTSLVLPVFLLIDLFITRRIRVVNFKCDTAILIGIVILFEVIKIIIDWKHIHLMPEIARIFISCIFTFDGYVITDWLIYKRNYVGGNYVLFSK